MKPQDIQQKRLARIRNSKRGIKRISVPASGISWVLISIGIIMAIHAIAAGEIGCGVFVLSWMFLLAWAV